MGKYEKLLLQILRGASDRNIDFADLCQLLTRLGFQERVKGSHHIFTRDGLDEILNLQPGLNKARPYQVRQVRNVIIKYKLGEAEDND
jgi:hypothetical protein